MDSLFALFPSDLAVNDLRLLGILMGVIFSGALVTSSFGIGGGILMTPMFILFLPAKFAIGLLAPLNLLISGTAVRQYWKQWDWHNLLVLLPSSLLGVWIGSYLLAVVSADAVRKIVGVLAIIFGIVQFVIIDRPKLRERLRPPAWQGVLFGLGSGITGALAHTGGIVFSFYLFPNSRTKEAFVATTVFLFLSSGILKIGTYFYFKILTIPALIISITLIPALLAGSISGKWLNRRIPTRLFMRLIPLIAILIGIRLLLG